MDEELFTGAVQGMMAPGLGRQIRRRTSMARSATKLAFDSGGGVDGIGNIDGIVWSSGSCEKPHRYSSMECL